MADLGYISPELLALVEVFEYKPGWSQYIQHELADDGAGGWHLFIVSNTENSLKPNEKISVRHGFLIPAASYNKNSWMNWLLMRCVDVETHEACEFFKIDGVRVFAPHHGNGENPYIIWHTSDYATAKKRAGED